MSQILALDWEKHRLTGLDAEVAKDKVRIRHSFNLDWTSTSDQAANAAEAGAVLQGELERLSIRGRQVVVCLPREDVQVRQLEVPDAPDSFLPDLVYLQAETKASATRDRFALDFLPLPKASEATQRQVLLVSIARQRIEQLRQTIEAAGCELLSVGISPAATAELVARVAVRKGVASDAATLVVARHSKRLEISLLRGPQLLFTHSAHLHGDDDQQDNRQAVTEIRRFLGARSHVDKEVVVARGWVIGSQDKSRALCQSMSDLLGCEVDTVDLLSDPAVMYRAAEKLDDDVAYAGPLGMLLAQAEPLVASVDLINPRKSVIQTDRRKLGIGAAAAAMVLISGLAYGGIQWRVSNLESQITRTQDDLTRLSAAVSGGKPTLAAAREFAEWDQLDIDWLARMHELNSLLPGTDRMYLVDARLGLAAGGGAAKIQAAGFARSRQDVEKFYQRLAEQQCAVQPHEISADEADGDYPYRFQLDVVLGANTNPPSSSPRR